MSKIGTMTTGDTVVSDFDLTFCPQYIMFEAGTPIKGLKVTVEGRGVICDLDQDGILAVSGQKQFSDQGAIGITTGNTTFCVQLATGFIKGVNVTISVTNSAAQTPVLYAVSERKPIPGVDMAFVQSVSQKALADSGIEVSRFGALFLPNAAASDPIIINRGKGEEKFQESSFRDELRLRKTLYSAPSPEATKYDYQIWNWDQKINSVNFTPAADQKVYVQRYQPIFGVTTKIDS